MRTHDEHAFTLVELIIVLAIVGILAAVAVPNFLDWLPDMRLKSAARDLYSNMQKARMIAVKTDKKTAITFDTANDKYDICDDWDTAGNCVGNTQSVSLVGYKSGVSYGHGAMNNPATTPIGTTFSDEATFNSNRVVFNSQGLGNAGYVYLDHQAETTTYAVGSQSSGVIKLLKWKGTKWE